MIPARTLFAIPGLPLAYDLAAWPFVTMAKLEIATGLQTLPTGSRILDVGVGTGVVARYLAKRFSESAMTGVDISSQMLARAKALDGGIEYIEGDARQLPVDGPYDAVVATYLLRHVPPEDAPQVFGELARVLAPGGRLVLVDLQLPRPGPRQLLGVWSLYSPEELVELAQASSLSYQKSQYFPLSILMVFQKRA